ncbi:MFS transporter [Streptomyces kunmingensis]|uniref:MFS transporter n=1 Tax=Streptomyces kunmingensis TaxID=68225 RepID=A0ABU6CS83_9ACTN|nr:MFS transporter [Streptomyces kunmingensis]MEB3966815.1 MFS transporter [Streptomyces kunmingensis]
MTTATADGTSLWRHRPFVLLCGEQIASSVGRQITTLALAVTGLGAGPFGAAALLALTYLPGAVLSPLAGVLVDRVRLRNLLVTVTAAQALVVGSVPLADTVGHLTRGHLYVVAAVSGALTFTLAVALQAALHRVVPSGRLLGANSALTAARTSGQIGGPALGGVLVGLAGPAWALLAGSVAYAVEALLVLALPAALNIRRKQGAGSPLDALCSGLAVVRAQPRLRRMVLSGAGLNLGSGAATALYVFYAARELALDAWQLGTTYAVYSAATIAGALLAGRFARTTGLWRATQACGLVAGAAVFLIPAASLGPAFALLLAYQVTYGLSGTIWMISMTTTQQQVTPDGLQGRVAGLVQSVLLLTVPVGAFAGGALAAWLGNVPVLLGSAAVALVSAATLWAPVRAATVEPAEDVPSRLLSPEP